MDYNALLPYVNNPAIGWIVRRGLWIPDRRYKIVKITPSAYHVHLGDGRYRATLYANNQYAEAAHKNLGWFMRTAHAWDNLVCPRVPVFDLGFATYSSQPDETSGYDNVMDSLNPTNNYGTITTVGIGELNVTAQKYRTLIKFDLSSIPSGAVASSATHSLWFQADFSSNARTFEMFRVLRDWSESQSTWNVYSTGNSWTGGGAGSDGNDADLTNVWSSVTVTVSETMDTEEQWVFTSTGITELNKFLNGTNTNYGWLHKAQVEFNDGYRFHSSNSATAGYRPKLVIVYLSGGGQIRVI